MVQHPHLELHHGRGAAHPRLRRPGRLQLEGAAVRLHPLYAYELGALDTRIPFEELRKLSYVNPKARALGDDPEFSRKMREGLPAPWRKK